jgi:hypothetical protein
MTSLSKRPSALASTARSAMPSTRLTADDDFKRVARVSDLNLFEPK